MTKYVDLCEKVLDHEMAVRKRLSQLLPHDEDAALTIELVKSARIMRVHIIDRLFQSRVEGDLSLLMKLRSLFSG